MCETVFSPYLSMTRIGQLFEVLGRLNDEQSEDYRFLFGSDERSIHALPLLYVTNTVCTII